jgi:hypothetical protein
MTAATESSLIAGVSEYTISHTTVSLRRETFNAGFGDLNVCFSNVPVGMRAYWAAFSNVFLMVSGRSNQKWRKNYGSLFVVILGTLVGD